MTLFLQEPHDSIKDGCVVKKFYRLLKGRNDWAEEIQFSVFWTKKLEGHFGPVVVHYSEILICEPSPNGSLHSLDSSFVPLR